MTSTAERSCDAWRRSCPSPLDNREPMDWQNVGAKSVVDRCRQTAEVFEYVIDGSTAIDRD